MNVECRFRNAGRGDSAFNFVFQRFERSGETQSSSAAQAQATALGEECETTRKTFATCVFLLKNNVDDRFANGSDHRFRSVPGGSAISR